MRDLMRDHRADRAKVFLIGGVLAVNLTLHERRREVDGIERRHVKCVYRLRRGDPLILIHRRPEQPDVFHLDRPADLDHIVEIAAAVGRDFELRIIHRGCDRIIVRRAHVDAHMVQFQDGLFLGLLAHPCQVLDPFLIYRDDIVRHLSNIFLHLLGAVFFGIGFTDIVVQIIRDPGRRDGLQRGGAGNAK